jgi:hypothetical protein
MSIFIYADGSGERQYSSRVANATGILGSARFEGNRGAGLGHLILTRPSTMLRTERLRGLIVELVARHMDIAEMSKFLACSQSAVRNYVHELTDAAVVVAPDGVRSMNGRLDKRYRLSMDRQSVERFLNGLSENVRDRRISTRRKAQVPMSLAQARYFHICLHDSGGGGEHANAKARRDPLVAALFGAAGMHSIPQNDVVSGDVYMVNGRD